MGMLLIVGILVVWIAFVSFTGGVWATYRLLDGDSQYDVIQWWRHGLNDVIPFYSAFSYRVRFWWRHKVRGLPIPEPYDGPLPNFMADLFKMSPTESPFLSMIGKEPKELTAGDYDPSDTRQDDDGS